MRKSLLLIILAACLCGSAGAMTDQVWYDAGWKGSHVNTANYKALARDYYHTGSPWVSAFGAREDGTGLVSVASVGGINYTEMAVVSNNYKVLTGIRVNMAHSAAVLGILADSNVVQQVYYNGTNWVVSDVNVAGVGVINQYKALAFDYTSATTASGQVYFYAARTDGTGVDQIYYGGSGSTWTLGTPQPSTTNYKAISTVYGNNGFVGAKADGSGMQQVNYSGGWVTSTINNVDYDVITDIGMGANDFACSRADGSGVDQVFYDNAVGWVTNVRVWPTYYKAMAAKNGANNHGFFGSYLCSPLPLLDIDNNCKVDFEDFAAFASEWLDCNKALPGNCN